MGERSALPWLRLVRLPNLLTVPGDPVAGFLLAAAGSGRAPAAVPLVYAACASLAFYAFGLILNDLTDRETDARERPERPIPSGQISTHQAWMAAAVMGLAGLNLARAAGPEALAVGGALAVLIALYDLFLKRFRGAGIVAMGLCRGFSLLLGAVAARPEIAVRPDAAAAPALVAAVGLTLYVTGFSAVARREAEAEKPFGAARWMPFAALLAALPAVLAAVCATRRLEGLAPTAYVFLMVMALMRAWLLGGMLYRLQTVPETVGGHIRNLLLVQGCLCVAAGPAGLWPALFFVALSLVFTRLAKRFYSS